MGQEVLHSHFTPEESTCFSKRLEEETRLLKQKLNDGSFSSRSPMGGFEIEAWLVDKALRPAPINHSFFELFDNPLATPELAKFNIELNNTPHSLKHTVFDTFEKELNEVFKVADQAAEKLDTKILLIGTLPTLKPEDCCLENMSNMKRYKALNKIILKARNNKPLVIDISGENHLHLTQHSVMMEATTTSFQIHLQAPWQQAHHYYNASIIASAPLMAVSGNSPFLFGKQLWHETRIPLFEQSIDSGTGLQRVSFGTGYAESSISECFDENLHNFPVLLPMLFDDKADAFSHLRLHNGVIWRWNRPLIGFDPDGTPHIRIEQRILPAGPTIVDMIANAVFFYGLTQSIMESLSASEKKHKKHNKQETKMPFQQAKGNFYQAAEHGLKASINWDNKCYQGTQLQQLIIDKLLPQAKQGLQQLGIAEDAIQYYLEIIADRTSSGQTGAIWQIDHLKQVDGDRQKMTQDYLYHQHKGSPVHTWKH